MTQSVPSLTRVAARASWCTFRIKVFYVVALSFWSIFFLPHGCCIFFFPRSFLLQLTHSVREGRHTAISTHYLYLFIAALSLASCIFFLLLSDNIFCNLICAKPIGISSYICKCNSLLSIFVAKISQDIFKEIFWGLSHQSEFSLSLFLFVQLLYYLCNIGQYKHFSGFEIF